MSFQLKFHEHSNIFLTATGIQDGKVLLLADTFFQYAHEQWLTPSSLPQQPLASWLAHENLPEATLIEPSLPIIYGAPLNDGQWFTQDKQSIKLGLDIFGSAFFMLTRYEEVVKPARDRHDRFPATASLAYQEGFLERPIIDEYVEILWACLKRLWPYLERKERQYSVSLTCDVDRPFGVWGQPWHQVPRRVVGDVLTRKSPATAVKRIAASLSREQRSQRLDPNNTFAWYMDQAEAYGARAAFYFLTGGTAKVDPGYDIFAPEMLRFISLIHERGHEVGLHPSYETYQDNKVLVAEADRLRQAFAKLGIEESILGGRQHYLRWDPTQTWLHWEVAQLDYDSSLSFADHAGFRCGTCRTFRTFSYRERRPLNLWERPLIVMERSLFAQQYMNLGETDALEKIRKLSLACKKMRGNLVLLWHNDLVMTRRQRQFFQEALQVVYAP
jgi:hypothetical protein